LQVLESAPGKIVLGAIVPEDLMKHRPSWWGDTVSAIMGKRRHHGYDGWGIVPLAGLRVMAVNNGDWKQLDCTIPIGITLRYMALLVAVFTVIPAWLIILYLAKSRPKIQGGPILRIIATRNGYASLSQFQITLWTFVLGGGVIYVMALSGALIDIPPQALTLLGISGAAMLTASLPGATASTSAPAPPASAAVPGVITRLRTIGNANATSVVLAWQPPAAGTAAAAYIVERVDNAGAAWTRISGTTDPLFAVTGLTAGTDYQFRVTATDAQGTPGPASASLAVRTAAEAAGGAPAPPQPPTILTAGESWITVQWTGLAPPPDAYVLQYRAAETDAAWTSAPGPIDSVQYRVTGLSLDTTYQFRLAAIGNGTIGAWSASEQARTLKHIPKWSDLIIWDGNNEVDVTRIQMLVFTLIAAGFILLKIGNESAIPDIPSGILLLMGISNGVYLTAKFIPPQR
jgi:chitodextrinase